jgi:hypothetical protein
VRRPGGRGRDGSRRLAAATLLALGAAWAAPALANAPACLTSLELEPTSAFVDQQVLYRLRILSREDVRAVDWLEPPAFPGLRAEHLPGRPEAGLLTREGVRYRVREEHRALFPERAGELAIGPARLRCWAGQEVLDASVPQAVLRVRKLPAPGRPADFAGLVGPVALSLRAFPSSVALGASVHLELRLQGGGNLWDAPDPLPDDAALGDAEVFRQRPELELERGTSLFVRRRFAYDVVPHREGVLVVPELRVAYFDPIAERYAEARVAGVEVAVGPHTTQAKTAAHPPQADPAPAAAASGRGPWPWIAVAAGGAALAAGAALVARRRRLASGGGVSDALAEAAAAERAGHAEASAAALARALRAGLARHLPEAERRTPEQRLAGASLSAPVRAALELLAEVERARFDPAARAPEREAIERVLAQLRTHPES